MCASELFVEQTPDKEIFIRVKVARIGHIADGRAMGGVVSAQRSVVAIIANDLHATDHELANFNLMIIIFNCVEKISHT